MFNIIICLFLQFVFGLPPQVESQSISTVDFIQVQGNQKTKDYIILREVQQNLYSPWTEESIIEDKNRIYNLGLFSSVHIDVITNEVLRNIPVSCKGERQPMQSKGEDCFGPNIAGNYERNELICLIKRLTSIVPSSKSIY